MQLLGDHLDILHIDKAEMVFRFEIVLCDHYLCKLAIIEHKTCEAVNEKLYEQVLYIIYETNIYMT